MLNQTLEKMAGMRLKDMAAEYRRQTELPAMDALSFEDRFALMIEAEWLARKTRRLTKLTGQADLPVRDACLEDINFNPKRKLDRSLIARLSNCSWVKEGKHMLITGMTGTGKTWIASAFASAACRAGLKVRCFKTLRLLNELTLGRNDGTWARVMDDLLKPDLIFIDDFGMEPLGAVHCRDLFELIDERHEKGSVMIAAQHAVKDWHSFFTEKTAADAVMDRLVNNSYRIELHGPSLRDREKSAFIIDKKEEEEDILEGR